MQHIVHLSSVHRADDTRIYVKECGALKEAGYEVSLVARRPEAENIEHINFISIDSTVSGRLRRMTQTVLNVGRAALRLRGDVYHFHDPELIPLGLFLKLLGKRVVYDVHETVPKQIMAKYWIPARIRRPLAYAVDFLERSSARCFDRVVAATPAIAERFPSERTVVVQNFALLREFLSIAADDYSERDQCCVYIGSITEARGARAMVRAIAGLDARLLLGGPFAPTSLQADLAREPGWEKVTYLGTLSRKQVQAALAQSRVGLIVLEPAPNYLDSYPVKLFEYMAAGLPVLASDFPFWRQFILDTGAGIMVDPEDPEKIATAIRWLLTHPEDARKMGERGRKAVVEKYSWEREAARLIDMYRLLFSSRK